MKKPIFIGLVVGILALGTGGVLLATSDSKKTTVTTKSTAKDLNGLDAAMDQMKGMDMSHTDSTSMTNASSVAIKDLAFSPATLTVKKGTTVTWTNNDSVGHTVTQDDASVAGSPGLDSKLLNQGETYSATFDTAGTFKYHCTVHPNMTATITVTE